MVRVALGDGAFKKGNDFVEGDKDHFKYDAGLKDLLGKKDTAPVDPTKVTDKPLESAHDKKTPVVDQERENLPDLSEYGYGFWLRFLTAYPVRLLPGKN